MLLSSIQIQGFKSFADKTVLKFGKGITGIVGPNGSGKSNISDAVRWVLGEQSTKSLRGQSMEDVIFGGTASRRPHGFCEVTLNIDNSDRALNFDGDFVSVTRRYYRSHESEYLINNVSVRLKDINELFMDTGLGRDGYSMVGQGKIDAIIGTKSGERRDIFEEASGISKYRYRKFESERKLALADENLLRLKDIIKELEERVGPLKTQSEKATKFLEFSDRKKELDIGLWLYNLENFKETLRNHENKITACKVRYDEIEKELSQSDETQDKNSMQSALISSDMDIKRREISSLTEQSAVLMGNISVAENDILHNRLSAERLEKEIEELLSNENSVTEQINKNRLAAEEKNNEYNSVNEKLLAAESELSGLLTDSENFSRNIEILSQKLNELSAKQADLRVAILSSDAAVKEIDERESVLNDLIADKHSEIERLSSEFSQTQALIDHADEEITSCENALKGYQMRLDTKNEAAQKIKNELEETRLDIEGKKRRVQILKDLENSMEGFSHSVKTVMKSSESGILRGVCGPVSRIINVDKKFAVAIETALGGALQNIVVETQSDAKRAINSLKDSSSGRATFLPIESIRSRPFTEKGYEDMFGYVGIAADLVDCDEKYREIIAYLLGGVVVTEDIDTAITMAKKFKYHFKIVSLDGQVVNAGGSITGGSLIKNAGLLSRKDEIKRINEKIDSLTEKRKKIDKEYVEALSVIDSVKADIDSAAAALKTAGEDKIMALAELKRIGDIKKSAEELLSSYETEKKSSGEKRTVLNNNSEKSEEELKITEREKSEIEEQSRQLAGNRETLFDKRDEITDRITALKLSAIECKKDAETFLLAAETLETSLTDRDGKIEEKKALIEKENELISTKQADIEAINAATLEIKQKIESLEAEITQLTVKKNELEQQTNSLRSAEKLALDEREKLGNELARLTERKENMTNDYENVIKQLFEEYGLTRTEAENMGIKIDKPADAKRELSEIKGKIKDLGNVNVAAIEEYKEVSERYEFMSAQVSDVERSRAELSKLINGLTVQMKEMFTVGFERINECFTHTFTELFGGGSAKLVLTDPDNVLESGIDINAKLPGKNVPSLDGLSGGEKALVALSIYFAIMKVNAPPFCFLDEVDTALDDINVERFAQYMKSSQLSTQFICVTHRRGTMEAADMLYGVTMQEKGVTKLLELNVAELERKLAKGEI